MKKPAFLLVLFCGVLPLFAEGQGDRSASAQVRIGIAKFIQHEALEACEQGVQDALRRRGVNAVFDLQNANGDMNAAAEIAGKFRSGKLTAAVGIATPMAIALANTLKDIPVIFSAVTDPVGAKLVSSLAHGEKNITGLSDAIPTIEHIAMFVDIAGIKTLGYIYTGSEANSISALAQVEAACKKLDLKLVTRSISGSGELKEAAEAIVGRVDGIYLTTDNTVYSALPTLVQVFARAKKPIFSGAVTGVLKGGCLVAAGFNYYKAGLATGNIVADIILEGKRPADIPVKLLTDPDESALLFDLDTAKRCGITIPEKYLSRANYIFADGKLSSR